MGVSVAFYVPLLEYPHASREPAAPQFVFEERWRIGDDVENLGLQLRAIVTLRDEFWMNSYASWIGSPTSTPRRMRVFGVQWLSSR